jgi:hypothetical protein
MEQAITALLRISARATSDAFTRAALERRTIAIAATFTAETADGQRWVFQMSIWRRCRTGGHQAWRHSSDDQRQGIPATGSPHLPSDEPFTIRRPDGAGYNGEHSSSKTAANCRPIKW